MERMLITIKEHIHPSMKDQADTTTRGVDLVMTTIASRATTYPQDIGGATKKEASIGVGGIVKKDNTKGDKPKYLDPSAKYILNRPCHINYAYLDRNRVSNHLMRDCRTFVKLQEAMELHQGVKPGSTAYD
jgi:hypothetical protein